MLIELALREETYSRELACLEPTFERAHVRLSMTISRGPSTETCSGATTGKPVTFEKSSSVMLFQYGAVTICETVTRRAYQGFISALNLIPTLL